MKYLIENGADSNIPNRDGKLAFNFAEDSKKQFDLGVGIAKKTGLTNSKNEVKRDNFDAIMRILHNKNDA